MQLVEERPNVELRRDADGSPIPGTYEQTPSPLSFSETMQLLVLAPINGIYGLRSIDTETIDTEAMKFAHRLLIVDRPGVNKDSSAMTHLNEPRSEDRHAENASRQLHRVNRTQGRRPEANQTEPGAHHNEQRQAPRSARAGSRNASVRRSSTSSLERRN